MSTASIIYWYDEDHLRRDGGGLRALAWKAGLESAGLRTRIDAIHPGPVDTSPPSAITRLKRTLAPMPFARDHALPSADVVVAAVPGVFPYLARRSTAETRTVIFDWMDLWSANARTMGSARALSTPGGWAQSLVWMEREKRLPRFAGTNTFAGYADLRSVGRSTDYWLPTPVDLPSQTPARSEALVRRAGFIGNLNYEPNELSLRWFLRNYYTKFETAGIEVVVGGFGSEKVRDWNYPLRVVGEVSDLDSFYRNIDAALVPIRHGGGIKVKAIEALTHGVPVLATRHVREGFDPKVIEGGVVDLDQFISDRWPRVPGVDAAVFRRAFSQNAFDSTVSDILTYAFERPRS